MSEPVNGTRGVRNRNAESVGADGAAGDSGRAGSRDAVGTLALEEEAGGVGTADAGRASHLTRSLSHGQMAMIAMGSALGTGLFLGSGAAIGTAGPAVIISFAIGSSIAIIIALAMGEMASRYPVQGGFGTLATHFLGPFWGYLARWMYWIVAVSVTAAELVACAHYLRFWFPDFPLAAGIAIFALIAVGANLASVGSFGVLEFWLSSIKVIAVLVFIVIGVLLVAVGLPGSPATGVANLTADAGFAPSGALGVWLALAFVMFSFGGIELLSISAAEAKDPARSIRSAARNTVLRLSFFYVAAIAIIVTLVPWRVASGAGDDLDHSPFVLAFDKAGIPGAAHITNLIVLIAALSAANAMVYAGSRFLHSLASDGFAPRVFAVTTSRGVPARSIGASTVGIVVVVVLAVSEVAGLFPLLMSVVTFSLVAVWLMVLATYVRYAPSRDGKELFRLPGGVPVAVIGIVGLLSVYATVMYLEHMRVATAVGVPFALAVSLAYVLVFRHRVDRAGVEASFAEAERARQIGSER